MEMFLHLMKLYTYQGCSTCKSAVKWLRAQNISFTEIPIRETPPSVAELTTMLKAQANELRLLFNTSGQDYRALGMKDKLPTLGTAEALEMLSENGNLVKRPFAIDDKKGVHLVGFKEDAWAEALL
jgi:arsenate reductase (glutaredoxin)